MRVPLILWLKYPVNAPKPIISEDDTEANLWNKAIGDKVFQKKKILAQAMSTNSPCPSKGAKALGGVNTLQRGGHTAPTLSRGRIPR